MLQAHALGDDSQLRKLFKASSACGASALRGSAGVLVQAALGCFLPARVARRGRWAAAASGGGRRRLLGSAAPR
eukprot:15477048-Alexandrium_andersonii.AAC.1